MAIEFLYYTIMLSKGLVDYEWLNFSNILLFLSGYIQA